MKYKKTTRRDGIQTTRRHPVCKLSFEVAFAATEYANAPAQDKNTEKRKEVASLLRQGIRDINRLAQVLKTNKPIPERIYDTRLVDSLLYQTENLISICERYACPLLEQTDNNKNLLP